jgi:hypothetical protein
MTLRQFSAWLSVACALLVLSGCSSENTGKVEGTKWSNTAYTHQGKQVPAGVMTWTFGKDGSFKMSSIGMNISGTYSLGFGQNYVLNLNQAIDGSKKVGGKMEIKGNTMKLTDPDGTTISFKKI